MRESLERKKKRLQSIIRLLDKYYPGAHCALTHSNPLELLIATILSAQCTDERVNQVTPKLFAQFPDVKSYAQADLLQLEMLIRPTGFYKNKAKNIKMCCQMLLAEFGGEIPQNIDDLVRLPGVGRKTANVVLGNAFNIASGVVVDTHVRRISNRLGLVREMNPEKVEQSLNDLVPRKQWVMFSHWLIFHGRQVCKARKPQCATCFLEKHCPQGEGS